MTDQQQTPDTSISPEMQFGIAVMSMKPLIDQLRHFTNGIRADYLRDGYTEREASSMASTDHDLMVEFLIGNLRGEKPKNEGGESQ